MKQKDHWVIWYLLDVWGGIKAGVSILTNWILLWTEIIPPRFTAYNTAILVLVISPVYLLFTPITLGLMLFSVLTAPVRSFYWMCKRPDLARLSYGGYRA
jgi:hypothetical protein